MTDIKAERQYRAPALERGFDILELLVSEGRPLSLQEIGEKLKKSSGELFRMVAVLERRGFISRGTSGDKYTLTNKLFRLGMEQQPNRDLLAIALPVMHILSSQIDQSCHLTVQSEDRVVVIARAEGPGATSFVVKLGYNRAIHRTTSGRLLFAYQPVEIKEQWLALIKGKYNFSEEVEFLEATKTIRKRGYSKNPSSSVKGVIDIATPILQSQHAIASLTVPFVEKTPNTLNLQATIEATCQAAEEISRKLKFGTGVNI